MHSHLGKFALRSLEFFALSISAHKWRVVLSTRAKYAVTVVLESNTIVLDPTRTGLFDLAVASCCHVVNERRTALTDSKPSQRNAALRHHARRNVIPEVQKMLVARFPRLASTTGNAYLPGSPLKGFAITEQDAMWNKLPRDVQWSDGLEMELVSDIGLHGIEQDMKRLMAAFRRPDYPWEVLEGLEEFPVAVVPFRLSTANPAELESSERLMNDPEVISTMNGIHDCMMRKSESIEERIPQGALSHHGVYFDSNQLAAAVVAAKRGSDARLFRRKHSSILPNFDPRRHLVYLQLDLNDLANERGYSWSQVQLSLLGFLRAYEMLDIDLVIEAFGDQLIKLPTSSGAESKPGRKAIVQFRTVLKRIDQPFDDLVWHHIRGYLSKPPKFPGRPVSFHPLTAKHIGAEITRLSRQYEHAYRTLFWFSRSGMGKELPYRSNLSVYERMAKYINVCMDRAERSLPPGQFDPQPVFVPNEIIDLGEPRGFLSRTYNANPQ